MLAFGAGDPGSNPGRTAIHCDTMTGQTWVRRLYHPEPLLFAAEVTFCTLALILVFVTGNEMNPVVFALYAFSTYVLGIGVYFLVLIIRHSFEWRWMSRIRENRYEINRAILCAELVIGLAYSVLLTFSGLESESSWMFAAAGYYLLLAVTCAILIRKRMTGSHEDRADDLKVAFHTGILMIPLAIAVITMVILAVNGDQDVRYPDLFIYAVATFTFIFFTTAIVNVIRFRGFSDPIFGSIKRFSMNRAIFSMFMLQLAMLSEFGGEDTDTEFWMNLGNGVIVCIAIALITAYQVFFSYRNLRETSGHD